MEEETGVGELSVGKGGRREKGRGGGGEGGVVAGSRKE